MKKTPWKLVLRSQTLRALAEIELARATGGLNSNNAQCSVVADTGDIACPTWPK